MEMNTIWGNLLCRNGIAARWRILRHGEVLLVVIRMSLDVTNLVSHEIAVEPHILQQTLIVVIKTSY